MYSEREWFTAVCQPLQRDRIVFQQWRQLPPTIGMVVVQPIQLALGQHSNIYQRRLDWRHCDRFKAHPFTGPEFVLGRLRPNQHYVLDPDSESVRLVITGLVCHRHAGF
uniref:Uncharacterized protein n=1 Tax=Spongospora subterranea TaxID=70186 RepID=A0A0H5QFW1_9EUKA|eukprot:CRZ00942.1 hypothetical protein [Spongospora subterranea]